MWSEWKWLMSIPYWCFMSLLGFPLQKSKTCFRLLFPRKSGMLRFCSRVTISKDYYSRWNCKLQKELQTKNKWNWIITKAERKNKLTWPRNEKMRFRSTRHFAMLVCGVFLSIYAFVCKSFYLKKILFVGYKIRRLL